MFTRILALATFLSLYGFALSQEKTLDLESARKCLESFKEEDTNLRSDYRSLSLQSKKVVGLTNSLANARVAAANTRLPSATRSLARDEIRRVDNELPQAKDQLAKMENAFKEKQLALLKRVNSESGPAIRVIGLHLDDRGIADLLKFTELFVLDPKQEVAGLQVSMSFIDQPAWEEASKTLGKRGTSSISALAKGIDSTHLPTKFAAAVALGDIGPEVHRYDTKIVAKIGELYAKTNRSQTLDRTERDNRCKILKAAMDKIQPK